MSNSKVFHGEATCQNSSLLRGVLPEKCWKNHGRKSLTWKSICYQEKLKFWPLISELKQRINKFDSKIGFNTQQLKFIARRDIQWQWKDVNWTLYRPPRTDKSLVAESQPFSTKGHLNIQFLLVFNNWWRFGLLAPTHRAVLEALGLQLVLSRCKRSNELKGPYSCWKQCNDVDTYSPLTPISKSFSHQLWMTSPLKKAANWEEKLQIC